MILTAVLLPARSTWPFAACFAVIGAIITAARLPLVPLLKRAAAFGPFILTAVVLVPFTRRGNGAVAAVIPVLGARVAIFQEGLVTAKGILLKSLLSALCVLTLMSTTRFSALLKALEQLRFPRLLLTLIAFVYRYLLLLAGEFQRLTRAARSRNWAAAPLRLRARASGGIVGSLFLRTYARGERVYLSMLARGFDGTARAIEHTHMSGRDYAAIGAFMAIVLAILVPALARG